MILNCLWFVFIFSSLGGLFYTLGATVDDALFSCGAVLFIYSLSKIYFTYLRKTNFKNPMVLESIIFPNVIVLGVIKRFGLYNTDFSIVHLVLFSVVFFLLIDIKGRVRSEINKTFIAKGWDEDFERGLLFSSFPPKKISDMFVFNVLVFGLIVFLFV